MTSRHASRFTTSVSSPWAACCAKIAEANCCCSLMLVIDASLITLSAPLRGATTLSRGPGGVGRTPGRSRPSDQREGLRPAPTQSRRRAHLAVRSTRAQHLIPLQGATLPGIEKTNCQYHQERQYGYQPGQTELTEHHRPGV